MTNPAITDQPAICPSSMSESMNNENSRNANRKLIGLLGQFDDPGTLLQACHSAREAGLRKIDAYTPFPVHGIEQAMGIRRTILPFIVLFVGLGACGVGIGLQWFTNATEGWGLWSGYQFKISGKPYFSLPANIPVTFEIIVLSSAFAAFLGMLALNRLPCLANPLHRIPRFRSVTNDRFFLSLGADENGFDSGTARDNLNRWGATDVEEIWLDETDHRMPAFLKTVAILGLILLLVPPVMIYRARGMTSRQTRLHVNPDMDFQVKFLPQSLGPISPDNPKEFFFPHKRSGFAPVPGTVPRGKGMDDIEFKRGIQAGSLEDHQTASSTPAVLASSGSRQESGQQEGATEPETPAEPDWLTRFPASVDINEQTLLRGQEQYNINCAVCHGYSGEGNGLVNQRALGLVINGHAKWNTARSLYDPEVINQPVGRIFDTITNGRSMMGPYGSRIRPADRWAIVLYVKALQETRINSPQPDPNTVVAEAGDSESGTATDDAAAKSE